jgi:transcriptional regulator with XRE-family HTH domain
MPHFQNAIYVEKLIAARKKRGLSQIEFGKMAGLPQSYISSIENGKRDIRLSTLIELSRLLGLELIIAPRELSHPITQLINEHNGESESDERAFVPQGDDYE